MAKVKDSVLLGLLFAACIVFFIPLMILSLVDDVREDYFYDNQRKAALEKAKYYNRYP